MEQKKSHLVFGGFGFIKLGWVGPKTGLYRELLGIYVRMGESQDWFTEILVGKFVLGWVGPKTGKGGPF